MITDKKEAIKNIHNHCIVCGQNNHHSLKLEFSHDENGKTYARFCGDDKFQGYNGILHGGIITTLLDATMTHCLFHYGVAALTGDLHVRFLKPIPYNAIITIQAQIMEIKRSIYWVKAEVVYKQKIMAWAEAKFVKIDFMNL